MTRSIAWSDISVNGSSLPGASVELQIDNPHTRGTSEIVGKLHGAQSFGVTLECRGSASRLFDELRRIELLDAARKRRAGRWNRRAQRAARGRA